MQIVLQQVFPLGRFHATPWRANPFDDPHGEWPPSPWRLVRTIVARWYQWAREATPELDAGELDSLVAALCTSRYRFFLPPSARRGSPARQYFPVDFGWNPKGKDEAAVRTYGTSLAQDNYWCVAPTDAVWWFIDGGNWTAVLVAALDHCTERISYFGRAEAFTRIRRITAGFPAPNCDLGEYRTPDSVPVLVPSPDASRSDVERTTDDARNVRRSIPTGSRTMYATRPPRPPTRETPHARLVRPDCRLVQFALGWSVAPAASAVVRLTTRFRDAVLRELLRIKTSDQTATWSGVGASIRESVADMFGKDALGKPLTGHRHTEFLAWCEGGAPVRLLVWRGSRPFDDHEQTAILRAASRDFSWAAAGPDADTWKVRLVPLDRAVPPPPGFDGASARAWESVTPYVPPRHHLRGGKPRERESLVAQVRRELALRGFGCADEVEVEVIGNAVWVAVHVPRGQTAGRRLLGENRGCRMCLTFPQPIQGPLRLGHSSSLGLGLFGPNTLAAGPAPEAAC